AADGEHARVDGLASLGAAAGVAGSWAGVPVLDPAAGLLLTVVIALVAWETARSVSARLLDEADASLVATIEAVAAAVPGVVEVREARARWTGRQVQAALTLAVPGEPTVASAHALPAGLRPGLFPRARRLPGLCG